MALLTGVVPSLVIFERSRRPRKQKTETEAEPSTDANGRIKWGPFVVVAGLGGAMLFEPPSTLPASKLPRVLSSRIVRERISRGTKDPTERWVPVG